MTSPPVDPPKVPPAPRRSRRPPLVFKLILAAVSLLLTLCVIEGALHVWPALLPGWYRYEFPYRGIEFFHPGILARTPLEGWPELPAGSRFRFCDPVYSGFPPKNLVDAGIAQDDLNPDPAAVPRFVVRTDPRGFPNPAVLDRADVVLIGDSFGVGAATEDPPGIVPLLAAKTGLSFYNVSLTGLGPTREVWLLEHVALPLRPKTVLWLFYATNDFDEWDLEAAEARGGRTCADLHTRVVYPRIFILDILERWVGRKRPAAGLRPFYFPSGEPRIPVWFLPDDLRQLVVTEAQWRTRTGHARATRALVRAQALCAAAGARLIVAFVPSKEQVLLPYIAPDDDLLFSTASVGLGRTGPVSPKDLKSLLAANRTASEKVVAGICRDAGIEFVSLLPVLEELARAGGLPYLSADTHWAPAGQAAAAPVIERALGR